MGLAGRTKNCNKYLLTVHKMQGDCKCTCKGMHKNILSAHAVVVVNRKSNSPLITEHKHIPFRLLKFCISPDLLHS